MSDTSDLKFRISATDGVTPATTKIAGSLDKIGKAATDASRTAGQGFRQLKTEASGLDRSLDAVQKGSAETARDLAQMAKAADLADREMAGLDGGAKRARGGYTDLRSSIGDVASVLSSASAAAAEEGAIFDRLQASVEGAGDAYDQYATQIDAAIAKSEDLSFADDQAATALSNLTQITGSTSEALNNLGLAQDLARGKGMDLATAATIVGKVSEGNIGILARYGIAVREGASAQEALGLLQERYAGQAQAYAESNQGAIDRLTNSFDNQLETIGANTGQMQVLLALLPGIGVGYDVVATASTKATAGVKGLTAGTKLAAVATSGLGVVTGPVGLALGAVALAAGGAVLAFRNMRESQDLASLSSEELAASTDDLLANLVALEGAGTSQRGLDAYRAAFEYLRDSVGAVSNTIDQGALSSAAEELERVERVLDGLAESDSFNDFGTFYTQADVSGLEARREALERYVTAQSGALISEESYQEAQGYLGTILSDTARRNYPELEAAVFGLQSAHEQGLITNDAYIDGLETLAGQVDTYGLSLDDIAPRVDAVTTATQRLNAERIREINLLAGQNRVGIIDERAPVDRDAAADRAAARLAIMRQIAGEAASGIAAVKEESAAAAVVLEDKFTAAAASASAAMVEYRARIEAAADASIAFVADGENIIDVLQAMGDAGADLSIAEGIVGAQAALDSTFGIIAGGTQALGQSAQQVADFASELAGVTYEAGVLSYAYAAVDEALGAGLITTQEYNAAVTATEGILRSNAGVQLNLSAIQAQQLPYLEEQTAAYAAMVYELSLLAPAEQRHALALIDSGSRAKIAETYSLAYAASLGQIPEEVASEIILNAAAVDPILNEYYQKKGLIEKDPITGELTVNFDAVPADAATEAIADLTVAIQDLTGLIAELNGIDISPGTDDRALKFIDDMNSKLGETESVMDRINRWGGVTPPPAPSSDGTGGYVAAGDGTGGPVPSNSSIDGLKARQGAPQTQIIRLQVDPGNVQETFADIRGQMAALGGTQTTVTLGADGSGVFTVFRDVEGAIVGVTDGENVVRITGDTADASNDIALVNEAMNAINGTESVTYVNGDNSGALNAVTTAEGRRDAYDGTSALAYFQGDASGAVGAADQAAGALYSIDGDTGIISILGDNSGARAAINAVTGYQGEAYVNVTMNRAGGIGFTAFRDGGVVPMPYAIPEARNGIVMNNLSPVRMNETGGEMVMLPGGSMVIPAPATRNALSRAAGSGDVHFNFYGDVNGADELRSVIRQELQAFQIAGNR